MPGQRPVESVPDMGMLYVTFIDTSDAQNRNTYTLSVPLYQPP